MATKKPRLQFKADYKAAIGLRIGDKWISNGHWALTRTFAERQTSNKSIVELCRLARWQEADKALDNMTPKNDLVELSNKPLHILTNEDLTIGAVVYEYNKVEIPHKIGIASEYAALMNLEGITERLVRDSMSPVVLKSNDEIVGMIMPVRL